MTEKIDACRIVLEGLSSRAIVICKQVAKLAVDDLIAMTPSGLAGDDAELESVWEEICAQVQGEESPCWDAYLQTIEEYLLPVIESLSKEDKCTLWLATNAGDQWIDDNCQSGTSEIGNPVYCIEDIVDDLIAYVLSMAANYESASLRDYLFDLDEDDSNELEDDEDTWLEEDSFEDDTQVS